MSTGRAAVRMSGQEVQDFLAAENKVQVATIGRDGAPHLSTLFYVLDQGRIAFWTYGSSQKVLNLRRDPRLTCLVEGGEDYFELRGVSVRGRARLIEDYDAIRDLGARVARRMAGARTGAPEELDLGELGDQIVEEQAHKRVGIVVDPEHVASWDHSKMVKSTGNRKAQ